MKFPIISLEIYRKFDSILKAILFFGGKQNIQQCGHSQHPVIWINPDYFLVLLNIHDIDAGHHVWAIIWILLHTMHRPSLHKYLQNELISCVGEWWIRRKSIHFTSQSIAIQIFHNSYILVVFLLILFLMLSDQGIMIKLHSS